MRLVEKTGTNRKWTIQGTGVNKQMAPWQTGEKCMNKDELRSERSSMLHHTRYFLQRFWGWIRNLWTQTQVEEKETENCNNGAWEGGGASAKFLALMRAQRELQHASSLINFPQFALPTQNVFVDSCCYHHYPLFSVATRGRWLLRREHITWPQLLTFLVLLIAKE